MQEKELSPSPRFITLEEAKNYDPEIGSVAYLDAELQKTYGSETYYVRERYRGHHWDYGYHNRFGKPVHENFPLVVLFEQQRHSHDLKLELACNDFEPCRIALYGNNSVQLAVRATVKGRLATVVIAFATAMKLFGAKLNADMQIEMNGVKKELPRWVNFNVDLHDWRYSKRSRHFDFTVTKLRSLSSTYFGDICDESKTNIANHLIKQGWVIPPMQGHGLAKSLSKIQPIIDALRSENILAFCYLRDLILMSNRTIDGVKVSSVLNETFNQVKSTKDLISLWDSAKKSETQYHYIEEGLKALPGWKEKRRAALKSQGNRAFTKLMEEYESLQLDEKKFPKTAKAIKSAEIPVGTFFRKSEQYYLVNDNWPLWEGMLAKHRDVTIELAKEVSKRAHYEKDLMSYFYFVLHALPAYLRKHTGKKWTCVPKLVDSQEELEPPTAENNGIARKRSALTPVADNETNVVTVPYASLAIPGRQTTYCYAHDYNVLREGFSFNGNVVTSEIEKKLNGRDDYGLMFYTLTGSAQGRGYPTFLIIFERKSDGTVVHFHRTHPSRSKQGDYNAISNWIRVCYNWMAGNIPKSAIKAQQGDLVFVETDKNVEFTSEVTSYDKHCFEKPVKFAEGPTGKSTNILCYVKVETDNTLLHTEHENVPIPAGTYAIHQCRSWEANPRGVWSLRID